MRHVQITKQCLVVVLAEPAARRLVAATVPNHPSHLAPLELEAEEAVELRRVDDGRADVEEARDVRLGGGSDEALAAAAAAAKGWR